MRNPGFGAGALQNDDIAGEQQHRFSRPRPNNQSPRRRHLVAKLHRLGEAPLAHFVSDIERGGDIDATLERYAALPAEFIVALGGDRFPPALHAFEGGRR